MNPRSLNPFLISFALLALAGFGCRLCAEPSSLDAGLAAHRSSSVDASGLPVCAESAGSKFPEVPKAPSYVLTRDLVLSSVREQVASHFNAEGDLQLELLRPWVDSAAVSAPIEVTVAEFPLQLSSSVLVRLKAVSAGTVLFDSTVTMRAQLMRDAWVTRQPAARDEVFDPANLETRKVDFLRERDALPTTSGDRNCSFNRSVQAGRVVTWRDVSRRALVKKGEFVEVAAVEGALTVSMRGLALQSGAAGDVIAVRNIDSKKEIAAQVVSENRVQIHF